MNNIKLLPSLLVFAEVANKKSFSDAAKKLGLSKSAVSQHIKRLEENIGQQLLSRHTRGMSLTTFGERLVSKCELLREQTDLAFEEITLGKQTPSGRFALTICHSCERNIVIPALNQLCIEFPLIQPEVMITDQSIDLIQENLDIAIYGGKPKDSDYRALPIGTTNEFFYAGSRYLQKHGNITNLNDLNTHRLIANSWQANSITVYDCNSQKPLSYKPTYFARTNTLPSVIEMVLSDMGVALLPEFAVSPYLLNGRLTRVLPNIEGQQWPFYMIHRFQGEKPAHVSRFYQLVKFYFQKVNA